MHGEILPHVIFSPAQLALDLADSLTLVGEAVTLFSPGPVSTKARNVTADLSYFDRELAGRGDNYLELLKKHPLTFVTLARQVQSELISQAYEMANRRELDVVHVYTNEEELGLAFAPLCQRPVLFTHHDPFNFLIKYKSVLPKYSRRNWISLSYAQRKTMPEDTNWIANIYHGVDVVTYRPTDHPTADYVAYVGRIIEPKGVHLAITAVRSYNRTHPEKPLKLRIAGKHYAGHAKDAYWHERIEPQLQPGAIEYAGYLTGEEKIAFLANARALLVPSLFAEPFGMVSVEALACGTPIVGLDSGALPEVITDDVTGFIVTKRYSVTGDLDETATAGAIAEALERISTISRRACREDAERRFTIERMCQEHRDLYQRFATR